MKPDGFWYYFWGGIALASVFIAFLVALNFVMGGYNCG